MVQLNKKTRGVLHVTLAHEVVCAEGTCLCSQSEHRSLDLNPDTGETGVRIIDRRVADSVHLFKGEWSRPLPDSVLNLPEVAAEISAGRMESKETP